MNETPEQTIENWNKKDNDGRGWEKKCVLFGSRLSDTIHGSLFRGYRWILLLCTFRLNKISHLEYVFFFYNLKPIALSKLLAASIRDSSSDRPDPTESPVTVSTRLK